MPEKAHKPHEEPVKDHELTPEMSVDMLVQQMEEAWGFTAGKLATGVTILESMVKTKGCVKFLSFPADIVATGTRGIIKELVKRKLVDVVITTCGTLDHDVARCWKDYYKGSFIMNDSKLHREGLNRLGNVLVPNDSYGIIIEQKIQNSPTGTLHGRQTGTFNQRTRTRDRVTLLQRNLNTLLGSQKQHSNLRPRNNRWRSRLSTMVL